MDYEIRIFSETGRSSIVVRASCETDTAALVKIARMGPIDYQYVEVWRDLERIYIGRNVPRNCLQNGKVRDRAGPGLGTD